MDTTTDTGNPTQMPWLHLQTGVSNCYSVWVSLVFLSTFCQLISKQAQNKQAQLRAKGREEVGEWE